MHFVGSFLLAAALLVAMPLTAGVDQMLAVPPLNLAARLEASGPVALGAPFALTGRIEARTGSPKDLEIFFESSDDLRVEPVRAVAPALDPNRPLEYRLAVQPGTGRPGAAGSFVRLRVVYLPDYETLGRVVADPASYPNPLDRSRLEKIIAANRARGARQTDAVLFSPEPSAVETGGKEN